MSDGVAPAAPWARLPEPLARALRARMAAVVDAVVGEVGASVYAEVDDPRTADDIRRGVSTALDRFVALIGTTEPALSPGVRETFVDLGAAEGREDRGPETLLAALRTSARVLLREAAGALATVRPPSTDDVVDLADAVTAYVDELVVATTEGYTLQLREQAGERDRRRRLLAETLVRGSAPERAVRAAAEAIGWRPVDVVVPVLLPHDQTRQAQFRFRDDAVVLEREHDAVLLVRDGGSATRARLEHALRGRGAVIGVGVHWTRVPQAVRLAELTGRLTARLPGHDDRRDGLLRTEDHLATLALRGEQAAFALLAERRLAPFADLPAPTRDRLLETLHAWLRHWGSRAAVADELRVHPQTVSYRVRQLRDVLGDDLDDADARFELGLVLADRARR